MANRDAEANVADVRSIIGVGEKDLSAEDMCKHCNKMQLACEISGDKLKVKVPPTRSDILHPVDVVEDIAIAYGFNNVPKVIPPTNTVGKQQPVNQLSGLLRD